MERERDREVEGWRDGETERARDDVWWMQVGYAGGPVVETSMKGYREGVLVRW